MAEADIDEAMRGIERAGEAGFRLEAHVHRHRIDGEALEAGGGGDDGGLHPALPLQRHDPAAPEHIDGVLAQAAQQAEALAGEAGGGREHAGADGEAGQARARGGFQHREHLHPASEQFGGELDVERAVAGDQHPLAGRDALGAGQGLQRAGGHHPRQGPARQRHRAFMRAGGEDELAGVEHDGVAIDDGGDIVRAEGGPDQGAGFDHHMRIQHLGAQGGALGELAVWRHVDVAGGEGFVVLAAGGGAFIEHDDLGAALCGGQRRRQPGRTGADHQHIAGAFLWPWGARVWGLRGERQGDGAGDDHAVGGFFHAGALADFAIDGDHAFLAGADAAIEAAIGSGGGFAEGDDAGGGQSGGDGFTGQSLNFPAVKLETQGFAGRANGGAGQAHAGGSLWRASKSVAV